MNLIKHPNQYSIKIIEFNASNEFEIIFFSLYKITYSISISALLCHANNSLCFSEACNPPVLAHFVSINILRHFSNPYRNGSLMTTFQSDWSQEETVDENRGLAKLIQQKQN